MLYLKQGGMHNTDSASLAALPPDVKESSTFWCVYLSDRHGSGDIQEPLQPATVPHRESLCAGGGLVCTSHPEGQRQKLEQAHAQKGGQLACIRLGRTLVRAQAASPGASLVSCSQN